MEEGEDPEHPENATVSNVRTAVSTAFPQKTPAPFRIMQNYPTRSVRTLATFLRAHSCRSWFIVLKRLKPSQIQSQHRPYKPHSSPASLEECCSALPLWGALCRKLRVLEGKPASLAPHASTSSKT